MYYDNRDPKKYRPETSLSIIDSEIEELDTGEVYVNEKNRKIPNGFVLGFNDQCLETLIKSRLSVFKRTILRRMY